MDDYSEALSVAQEVALAGGKIALGHFRKAPRSEQKADGTWVTEADWAVEAQIRLRLSRAFPEHNVLGEEEGLTAAGGGPPVEGAPTWIVDPIDATHNYMVGIPIWATLIALRVEGQSVVGVAHAPALDETYDAAVGLGARMNGDPIRVDPIDRLEDAMFSYSNARSFHEVGLGELFETLTTRAWRNRGFGDFWNHLLVARGAAHVAVEPYLKLWDVAALEPIVAEAGGRLTGVNGAPWTEGEPCITTNGSLHDEVVRLARGTPDPGG